MRDDLWKNSNFCTVGDPSRLCYGYRASDDGAELRFPGFAADRSRRRNADVGMPLVPMRTVVLFLGGIAIVVVSFVATLYVIDYFSAPDFATPAGRNLARRKDARW